MRLINCVFILFVVSFCPFTSSAQNNTILAKKPPLGWNSYDSYGVYLHEKATYENLEAFAKKLKPFGYEYFVIDGMWYGEYQQVPGTIYPAEREAKIINMDDFGRVEPSTVYFPNGLEGIIDRAHESGIKLGLHIMRGIPRQAVKSNLPIYGTKYFAKDIADTTSICSWNSQFYGVDMTKPGAQEYYDGLYKKLADWGVDFLKVDDIVPFPKEIAAVEKAIRKTGKPVVYSLSPGDNTSLKHLAFYKSANMLRTTGDIWDNQNSIDRSFDAWRTWQGIGYPGFWPDLDMIPFGQLQLMHQEKYGIQLSGRGFMRHSKFTKEQMRTFITQRALSASPIMVGGDLSTIDDYSLSLLTNEYMLACNQNGHPATLLKENKGLEIWSTLACDIKIKGWIGFFNRTKNNLIMPISKAELEMIISYNNDYSIADIWSDKKYLLTSEEILFEIKPNDVLFLYIEELKDE